MSNATAATRTLIASDSGTHGGPLTRDLYRIGNASWELVTRQGGAVVSRDTYTDCPKLNSLPTDGRYRWIAK